MIAVQSRSKSRSIIRSFKSQKYLYIVLKTFPTNSCTFLSAFKRRRPTFKNLCFLSVIFNHDELENYEISYFLLLKSWHFFFIYDVWTQRWRYFQCAPFQVLFLFQFNEFYFSSLWVSPASLYSCAVTRIPQLFAPP